MICERIIHASLIGRIDTLEGGTESIDLRELKFIIIIFLTRRNRAWGNTVHASVYSTYSYVLLYILSTQFLLTFLLSYIRVTNG